MATRLPSTPPELEYPAHFALRGIRTDGSIKWKSQNFYVSAAFIGEVVDVKGINDQPWHLHFGAGGAAAMTKAISLGTAQVEQVRSGLHTGSRQAGGITCGPALALKSRMFTALALLLTALPVPREEIVFANQEMVAPPRSGRAARLLLQGAAGMGLGLALGMVGHESGIGGLVPCPGGILPTCPSAGSAGLQAGFGLGAGSGVYGVGEALGGDGSISGMGMGMGLGATTALAVLMFAPELGDAAALTLPLAGALVGYELGVSDAGAFSLRPSFSVWKGQISLGLKGEF